MESRDFETSRKRMKQAAVEETNEGGGVDEIAEGGDADVTELVASEEIEFRINAIMERIEQFTQQVSEMLDAGKALFKDLSNEFEERMINIHKEQMEKWQEEIKELRFMDSSNEETNAVLQNARHLLHNIQIG